MDSSLTWTQTGSWPMATVDVPLDGLDERALVEACLAGRRDAFDLIVERHRRAVYQLCYRFVANHEDASDLAQDVFVRASRRPSRSPIASSSITTANPDPICCSKRSARLECAPRLPSCRANSEPR